MSIGIFITPASVWRPPGPPPITPATPKTQAKSSTRWQLSWEDLAGQERWRDAIQSFLKTNWRGAHPLWRVVNMVVAKALPKDRAERRAYAKATLDALMQLVRERKVLRYRRRWVASVDLELEIVPIEQLKGVRVARI
jgi:hypothetical protein